MRYTLYITRNYIYIHTYPHIKKIYKTHHFLSFTPNSEDWGAPSPSGTPRAGGDNRATEGKHIPNQMGCWL